jgi:hypothetical protein
VLQPVPRRIVWAAQRRDGTDLITYLRDAKIGIPASVAVKMAAPVVVAAQKLNRATDEAIQRDLAALPRLFDHVDELLREGVLDADDPTVADYQIATSVALLGTLDDVAPMLEGRPAQAHAERIAPNYPGHTGPVFPPAWLPAPVAVPA